MTSPLTVLADVGERLETALGQLVDIEVERQNTVRDSVTGNFGFLPAVTATARIQGVDLVIIGADDSIRTARFMVTVWTAVDVGDRLTFAGVSHEVLEISGVLQDANGTRYRYDAVTN